jgi:molybdopterin-biosynthesis enzyme MoeA-like protein
MEGVIEAATKALSTSFDHVFTSGGIGPTHDDITADCIARALGDHIDIRADAYAILDAYYTGSGREFTESRKRMARIPDRATLIENPLSAAPGFTLENVHVMAGVPSVFEAMVQNVMATLRGGTPMRSRTLRIERGESHIAGPLANLTKSWPDLSFGSYPFIQRGAHGANIVIRGTDSDQLDGAVEAMIKLFPEAT